MTSGSDNATEFDWNLTSQDQETIDAELGNGWQALFTSFNMIFSPSDLIPLLELAYSPLTAKLVYIYYVVIVPLIMLNLLIALMGGEHAKVDAAEQYEGQR
eukprot:COSAG05_NODE_3953_length_1753_cov_3.051995_2_plen_101_part_00